MTRQGLNKPAVFNTGWQHLLVFLFIIISTAFVYWRVGTFEFINFDDSQYITNNQHVQKGLTLDNFKWTFGITADSNRGYWHPLTWLSHMLDCQLFGFNAGWHHLSGLLIHIINAVLLFLVLYLMTGGLWESAFVGSLFALHPLNVESVAWIAERKNLLSTLFWLISMLAYVYYVNRTSILRYLIIILVFTAGLLAKPMLVTLPFVFLLLDFWPLGRIQLIDFKSKNSNNKWILNYPTTPMSRLIAEKIPFIILSVTAIAFSFITLHNNNEFETSRAIPMALRLENALVSYIRYIIKIIWPHDLAVFYPFPNSLPHWEIIGSIIILAGISILSFMLINKRPYLLIGWLWFIGTLVPVIGIVQGGRWPALADRWTYIPAIGFFIMVSWGLADILKTNRRWKAAKLIFALIILMVLMTVSKKQVSYWADSISLFEHALNVTSNNYLAHYNLGTALAKKGKTDEAIAHYRASLQLNSKNEQPHINLGNALAQKGLLDEAISHYRSALEINPNNFKSHINLGNALAQKRKYKEAIQQYDKSLKIKPENAEAHKNLGMTLLAMRRLNEAELHFKKALEINPVDRAECKSLNQLLAIVYTLKKEYDSAVSSFQKIIVLQPDNPLPYYNIACIYARQNKKTPEATDWLKKAVEHGYDDWEHLKTDPDLQNIRDTEYYRNLLKNHSIIEP